MNRMNKLNTLAKNILFVLFCAGIVTIIGFIVAAAKEIPYRQTTIAIVTIQNTVPPYEYAQEYVLKRQFDQAYELERYWNFDRLEYMEKIFIPRTIYWLIGQKYGITATSQEIRQRVLAEQHRSGRTLDKWKQLLADNEVDASELDRIFSQKIIADKVMDTAVGGVDLSENELTSFYRQALKDIPGWESFESVHADVQREALHFKKLALAIVQSQIGTYQRSIELFQSPYLCRKSS